MKATLEVNNEDLDILRELVFVGLNHSELRAELGMRGLLRLEKMLLAALPAVRCRWCKQNSTRRSNQLCDPCDRYERRNGSLPTAEVLLRRARRASSRRPLDNRPRNVRR